jgi:hypothetical protein
LNCSILNTSFLTFEESTRQKFKNLIDFGTYHFYSSYGINYYSLRNSLGSGAIG